MRNAPHASISYKGIVSTLVVVLFGSGIADVPRVAAQSTAAVPDAKRQALPTDLGTRRFGEDWPKFLGSNQDGKSNETGIIKDWEDGGKPGASLKLLWQVPLKQSYGTCTVSRGRLFQFDSEPIGPPRQGRSTGKIMCLNSETGELLWQHKYQYEYADQYGYNNGPRNSPIVDGDRLFAYGVDGELLCLRADDGKELWATDANAEFGVIQNFFGVGSNPIVHGDLVIAMVGGSPAGNRRIDQAKGNGSGIVAFDKFTGKVRYKLSDELASYSSLKHSNALDEAGVLRSHAEDYLRSSHPRASRISSFRGGHAYLKASTRACPSSLTTKFSFLKRMDPEVLCLISKTLTMGSRRSCGRIAREVVRRRCKHTGTPRFITKVICTAAVVGISTMRSFDVSRPARARRCGVSLAYHGARSCMWTDTSSVSVRLVSCCCWRRRHANSSRSRSYCCWMTTVPC